MRCSFALNVMRGVLRKDVVAARKHLSGSAILRGYTWEGAAGAPWNGEIVAIYDGNLRPNGGMASALGASDGKSNPETLS